MPPLFWESWLQLFYERVKDHYKVRMPPGNDRVAIIVEPRNIPILRYVIYNFAYYLAPIGWRIHLYHGTENQDLANELQRELGIHLTNMNIDNLTEEQYNNLFTNKILYDKLPPTVTHLMVFQTDCILLKGDIQRFMKYDMIGAPWTHTYGCNGGLSIRKVQAIKRILETNEWVYDNEDGFFSFRYASQLDLPDKYKMAEFAVETIWNDDPVGLHKAYEYHDPEKIIKLLEKTFEREFK